jgi:hypothetical protein
VESLSEALARSACQKVWVPERVIEEAVGWLAERLAR